MKKEYKKPELLFDSFELSSSIAKTCENPVGFAMGACHIEDGGFTDNVSCLYVPEDNEPEKGCYHVFSEFFAS